MRVAELFCLENNNEGETFVLYRHNFLFLNIFHVWLVDSVNMENEASEGHGHDLAICCNLGLLLVSLCFRITQAMQSSLKKVIFLTIRS